MGGANHYAVNVILLGRLRMCKAECDAGTAQRLVRDGALSALSVGASSSSGSAGLRARWALGTRLPGCRVVRVAGQRGLLELLDLGGLCGGQLFNEHLDGDDTGLTNLDEIHAGHNIPQRGRGQSPDGRS